MAIQPGDVAAFQMIGGTFTLWALVSPGGRILQVCDSEETADWFVRQAANNNRALHMKPIGVWTSEKLDRLEGFWIDGVRYEVK